MDDIRLLATIPCFLALSGPFGCGDDAVTNLSCELTANSDGTTTLACPDGSSVLIPAEASASVCALTDNTDGTFSLSCGGTTALIEPGEDRCTVASNGDGTGTVTCGTTSVTLAQPTAATATLQGNVTLYGQSDHSSITVTIDGPGGTTNASAGGDGSFSFTSLVAGQYSLTFTNADYQEESLSTVLAAGATRLLDDVVLLRGRRLLDGTGIHFIAAGPGSVLTMLEGPERTRYLYDADTGELHTLGLGGSGIVARLPTFPSGAKSVLYWEEYGTRLAHYDVATQTRTDLGLADTAHYFSADGTVVVHQYIDTLRIWRLGSGTIHTASSVESTTVRFHLPGNVLTYARNFDGSAGELNLFSTTTDTNSIINAQADDDVDASSDGLRLLYRESPGGSDTLRLWTAGGSDDVIETGVHTAYRFSPNETHVFYFTNYDSPNFVGTLNVYDIVNTSAASIGDEVPNLGEDALGGAKLLYERNALGTPEWVNRDVNAGTEAILGTDTAFFVFLSSQRDHALIVRNVSPPTGELVSTDLSSGVQTVLGNVSEAGSDLYLRLGVDRVYFLADVTAGAGTLWEYEFGGTPVSIDTGVATLTTRFSNDTGTVGYFKSVSANVGSLFLWSYSEQDSVPIDTDVLSALSFSSDHSLAFFLQGATEPRTLYAANTSTGATTVLGNNASKFPVEIPASGGGSTRYLFQDEIENVVLGRIRIWDPAGTSTDVLSRGSIIGTTVVDDYAFVFRDLNTLGFRGSLYAVGIDGSSVPISSYTSAPVASGTDFALFTEHDDPTDATTDLILWESGSSAPVAPDATGTSVLPDGYLCTIAPADPARAGLAGLWAVP